MPLVGPRVDERAGAAGRKGPVDLGAERGCLCVLPVADAIQPELGHHERLFPREVLQTMKVGGEPIGRLEIHVVGEQVDGWQLQVLGGRVVDVGGEGLRILLAHRVAEAPDQPLRRTTPEPPHDRGWNLVGDREAEDRWVTRACGCAPSHDVGEIASAAPVVQVAHLPLGGEADHYAQADTLGLVEQPSRGGRVGAHGVDSVRLH